MNNEKIKNNVDTVLYLCLLCNFNTKEVLSYIPPNLRDFYRCFVVNACRFGRSLKVIYESK